jgi:hypothetical protein
VNRIKEEMVIGNSKLKLKIQTKNQISIETGFNRMNPDTSLKYHEERKEEPARKMEAKRGEKNVRSDFGKCWNR